MNFRLPLLSLLLFFTNFLSFAQEAKAPSYQQALKLYQDKAYSESILAIRRIIEAEGKSYKIHYLAGYNYWKLGSLEKARLHLQAAKQFDSSKVDIWLDLVKVYSLQKKYAKALKVNRAAIKTFPDSLPLKLLEASVLARNKQSSAALKKVEALKAAYSSDYRPLSLEARLYFRRKQYDKAEFSMKVAESLAPKHPGIKNNIALIYERMARGLLWRSKTLKKKGKVEKAKTLQQTAKQKLAEATRYLQKAQELQTAKVYQENLTRIRKLSESL
ncbi:MAG: hypothetical protein AAF518_18200 [Spirochaetota bacterium]